MATASVAEPALAPPEAAVPLLTEAVRRFSAADLRFDAAHSRLALAESIVATEVIDELSAGDDLARARRLADAVGEQAGGLLSPRESEVLRLVSQGMSNNEIAGALVLSEHTVHRHVFNIFTKLGRTSRGGAAPYATRAGLL